LPERAAVRGRAPYWSDDESVVKMLEIEVPTPLTAVMIAIAMPAAIRPYSTAVAPDTCWMKRETRFFMLAPDRDWLREQTIVIALIDDLIGKR
jgi:hypothetical protein